MLFRKSFSWDYSDIAINNPYSLIGYISQPIYIYIYIMLILSPIKQKTSDDY